MNERRNIESLNESAFRIDPRNYRKDYAYLGCLGLWGLAVLVFAVTSFLGEFWVGAVFGSLLLCVLPYMWWQKGRIDVLTVTPGGLEVSTEPRTWKRAPIKPGSPVQVTLEWVNTQEGGETTSTLNLWDLSSGYRRRFLLAKFVSQEDKQVLLQEMVDFLKRHQFQVSWKDDVAESSSEAPISESDESAG